MAEELADNEYWLVGAGSETLDQRVEYVLVDTPWPQGRYTRDPRQAWEWAHEFAVMLNTDPNSLATDWVGAVWAGKKK